MKSTFHIGICIFVFVTLAETSVLQAQTDGAANELKRLQGHWRIAEMTEDGRTLTESEIKRGLPGGGLVEIIDQTLLFKSTVDGHKSTKSFRIDAATYPKRIALLTSDKVTGVGIYEFDRGKLIVCVAGPDAGAPAEFSASKGSQRTLMILESFDPGGNQHLDLSPRPRTPQVPFAQASTTKPGNLKKVSPKPVTNVQPQPTPSIIIQQVPQPQIVVQQQSAAGRILTDDEVRTMLVGNWRMKDNEGLVDVTIYANGSFRTFRRSQTTMNFHSTFVPTPVSAGVWSVANGMLNMRVTSSWRMDKLDLQMSLAVRSISKQDAILADNLGRVSRAVKVQ